MRVKCIVCSKIEEVSPSRARIYKTCSKVCDADRRKENSVCTCSFCQIQFHRKPSEQRHKNSFCSPKCRSLFAEQSAGSDDRKLKKIIKNKWTALNIRAGIYKHLQTTEKCKTYNDISIRFSRNEFKEYCYRNKDLILSLNRPSIDRLEISKDYTLDNIQFIELCENIGKDKTVFTETTGRCYSCGETKPIEDFCKSKKRANGRSSLCSACDSIRNKKKYLQKTSTGK